MYVDIHINAIMIGTYYWKNIKKTSAVINCMQIRGDEIPFEDGDVLIGRYDKNKGLLFMKREKDIAL